MFFSTISYASGESLHLYALSNISASLNMTTPFHVSGASAAAGAGAAEAEAEAATATATAFFLADSIIQRKMKNKIKTHSYIKSQTQVF
jgi:hypothetical protein